MNVILKITKPTLFERAVAEVNTEGLSIDGLCFTGQLELTNRDGRFKPYFGLMEYDEFETEFGFQLIKRKTT